MSVDLGTKKYVDHVLAMNQDMILQEPLPMAVFGTLRLGNWNNRLMTGYTGVQRAYLPHFRANGLSLEYHRGSSCPFEIFHYTPIQWKMMIPLVDSLESFHPKFGGRGCYTRTMAMLRALPEGFSHPLFDDRSTYGYRSLGISPDEIELDTISTGVPCWIYSNTHANEQARRQGGGPILWSGVYGVPSNG